MKHPGKRILSGEFILWIWKEGTTLMLPTQFCLVVWGQIYQPDLVFQYIVAAGHRSTTFDFLQRQSQLTLVELMKMFHMLQC